jgi:hypothetical protein
MTTTSTPTLRARYMAHEITFNDYYGALVELLGEDALRGALPIDRTPAQWRDLIAEDQHLNNVPLTKWDRSAFYVRHLAQRADRDALLTITGSGGWSLSDSVCVLKETARRYAAPASDAR